MGLWQRLGRALFPPSDRETIREDLTDALQSGGELHEAFSADERAMLHNILRLREVRVEDVMVPARRNRSRGSDNHAWPLA
jgi:CBS domain containing-hemolysin-like protein